MNHKIQNSKRTPIITIMGHVNHGKTSLINCINKKKKKEKGNITQKINIYFIKTKYGNVTFLDTPGHEVFFDMRKRGINITDIIILVIAIDDGIMPQTIEIIKYSQKYKVPLIIAINKIDKKNYLQNIKIIKKKISIYNIYPKEWGGNNYFIEISTKNNTGINNLIKTIFLESKKIKLNIKKKKPTYGIIIESYIKNKLGIITNIIIKNGTIKIGDIILSGYKYGKIKTIFDNNNNKIKKTKIPMPVKILGFSSLPKSGKKFLIIKNKKIAKKIAQKKKKIHIKKKNEKENKKNIKINFSKFNSKKINLIIKCDTYSNIQVIKKLINNYIKNNIYNIIYAKIGNINNTDLLIANNSKATIIAFNIKLENNIKKNIKKFNIKIKFYNLIYKLIKDIKKISKKFKKNILNKIKGRAIIKNIFKSKNNSNTIAGCLIIKGTIKKNDFLIIKRKNKIIHRGKIKSIKIFKNKVNIVKKGNKCGINIKNFYNIKIGDIIEVKNI